MWMGISTNGIGKISVAVAPSTTTKESTQTDGSSFADIMELSNQNKTNISTPVETSNKTTDNQTTDYSKNYSSDTSNKVSDSTKTTDESKVSETTGSVDAKQTDVVKEIKSDDQPDSLKDVIQQVITKIYEVLQEKLGCTEEDIDNILEDVGMLLQDLLTPNNVRDFVLAANNASEVDLLISEQLPNLISDIQNAIADILDEFGVTAEDLEAFLKDFNPKNSVNVDETVSETTDPQAKTEQTNISTKNDEEIALFEQKVDIAVEGSDSKQSATNADTSKEDRSSVAFNLNQAIEQSVAPEQAESISDFQGDVAQADIVRQVVEAVRVNLSSDNTSMTLQLNPEHLGKVQISVIQKNGIMQAQIIAENEAAKNAIEGNLALLQESLEHQELKVESIEVMIASYEFFNQQEQQQEGQNSNQPGRRTGVEGFGNLDEVVEDEVLEDEIMRAQGNSVNYSI